jgi:hypothetical protein
MALHATMITSVSGLVLSKTLRVADLLSNMCLTEVGANSYTRLMMLRIEKVAIFPQKLGPVRVCVFNSSISSAKTFL